MVKIARFLLIVALAVGSADPIQAGQAGWVGRFNGFAKNSYSWYSDLSGTNKSLVWLAGCSLGVAAWWLWSRYPWSATKKRASASGSEERSHVSERASSSGSSTSSSGFGTGTGGTVTSAPATSSEGSREEPQGVISKQVVRGIPNIGRTCYLSSFLQAMYCTSFIDALNCLHQKGCLDGKPVSKALYDFFVAYTTGGDLSAAAKRLYDVLSKIKKSGTNNPLINALGCDSDVISELYVPLRSVLQNEFNQTGSCNGCNERFPFAAYSYRRYKKGKDPTTERESVVNVPTTGSSVLEALVDLFNPMADGSYMRLMELPKVLVVAHSPRVKAASCKFTLEFSFGKDCFAADAQDKGEVYELVAIALHRKTNAHYTSACSRVNGKWYFVNDNLVTEMPIQRMIMFGRGGFFFGGAARNWEVVRSGPLPDLNDQFIPRLLMYERVDRRSPAEIIVIPQGATRNADLTELSSQLERLSTELS